ncbi:hypothetical protein LCGC14_2260950, partial [marine sediment metagenome]
SNSAKIVRFISNLLILLLERDGAVWSARRAHNPEVGGSNPSPAILVIKTFKTSRLIL